MAKYIVETKGNHVTKHQLMIALVQVLGLDEVVSVENADQQSVQRIGGTEPRPCPIHGREYNGVCGLCVAANR